MSGGPNTALLLAALLAEKGERIRIIACDSPAEGEEAALFPHMEALLQRPVARERIELADAFDRTQPTSIGVNDLFLATAWWTAQIAKYAVIKTRHKTFIYLIQDYEPILHEGSTFQARALETYGLPHIPVINSRLLLDYLVREGAGCYADPVFAEASLWFEPALDRSYYFPEPGQVGSNNKKILLFYARPTVARRNLFELGVVALRHAVAAGAIDKDNWEVWSMGEKLPPVALGNGVFLNPLPWMSFDEYAKRVRTADLMLSLMLSPHPSYPPLEMAASGKLVVTNSFSVKTSERMRAFSQNIIVAEPIAESVAAALKNAAGRINLGLPSYDSSGTIALPISWDESLREILPKLQQRIQALRINPPEHDVIITSGFPAKPKTEYESYRRACLERRRREGGYWQEPGLLSFVTSAYNTDPVFLEELGVSLFQQDGGMHFEWLILDNGSSNESTRCALRELARHPKVRLMRVDQNLGIIGGMRYLLEHACGHYILPLDSDDLIEPDCVHVLTRFINANNYPPIVYTDEDKLGAGRFGSPYFKPDWDPVLFLHSCYIAHLCAIDREKALELDLYTDKRAEGCHDWDSFIRFMSAGLEPRHLPEVLYSWRIHEASTSGNIASKSYIAESHRHTLQRYLDCSGALNIELVNSPLFSYDVDWWFRRRRVDPQSMRTIIISTNGGSKSTTSEDLGFSSPLMLNSENGIIELADLIEQTDSELIHICWQGIVPDDDEWRWDAMALLELFSDSVMVGGILHDGSKIIGGPRIFGFGDGYDSPDRGRPVSDPGYSAIMWKAHSVSSVSCGHCVVRRDFLLYALPLVRKEEICLNMLGPWLGAIAAQKDKRVVFSPFMRAKAVVVPEDLASTSARAVFLSSFWSQLPDVRFYSRRLGLTQDTAYIPVSDADRDRHLMKLQLHTLPYSDWLDIDLQHRVDRYPTTAQPFRVSIITPVYHGSDLDLLDALSRSIAIQSVSVSEWIIVINGSMKEDSMTLVRSKAAGEWNACLIVEPQPVGIIRALRLGLEAALGEYVIPIDADDLITPDAMQVLAHEIDRLGQPDLLYSDEDMLIDGKPTAPFLRSEFDRVLALDNSAIWHLCAMKRDTALAANVYGDVEANWCQDWDTVSRIAEHGGRIEHVPEILYHWRQHAGSTTNNAEGDPRSLDSVRHILERHIARTKHPHRFYVTDWPVNRGARELYIARRLDDLPQLVWIGDLASESNKCNDDAILVFAVSGILIESHQVFVEVVRLFDLHPHVGAVGGLVEGKNGVVVDGCYMVNNSGMLESPWVGRPVNQNGPYALAMKTQSVATTGNSLAFFRVAALRQAGAWPPDMNTPESDFAMKLCGQLASNNWAVAFSPLLRARVGSSFRREPSRRWPPAGVAGVCHGLVRYGISRNYRD